MKSARNKLIFHVLSFLLSASMVLTACQASGALPAATPTDPVQATAVSTSTPQPTVILTLATVDSTPVAWLYSWASAAEATTQDEELGALAQSACGAPDVTRCGSSNLAWKPGSAEYPAQLTLYYYEQPLIPAEIHIILTNHPSQVVKVEVLDAYAEHPDAVVYEAAPELVAQCPYTLVIPVTGMDYPVMGVRITLQRAADPAADSQIDAVQLVGLVP